MSGVVVDEDQRARRKLQRAAHDLARVDGRVVDGAFLLHLVGDQLVLLVEEEDADVFPPFCFCCFFKWLRETSPKRPLDVPYGLFVLRFAIRNSATRLVCSSVPRLYRALVCRFLWPADFMTSVSAAPRS